MEVADTVWQYENFSGIIKFGATNCEVEDATFELKEEFYSDEIGKRLSIVFSDGELTGGLLRDALINDIVVSSGYIAESHVLNVIAKKTEFNKCHIDYGLLRDCVCHDTVFIDGIFNGGKFGYGVWETGVFKDGVFEWGTWNGGIWESGVWKTGRDKNGAAHYDSPDNWS